MTFPSAAIPLIVAREAAGSSIIEAKRPYFPPGACNGRAHSHFLSTRGPRPTLLLAALPILLVFTLDSSSAPVTAYRPPPPTPLSTSRLFTGARTTKTRRVSPFHDVMSATLTRRSSPTSVHGRKKSSSSSSSSSSNLRRTTTLQLQCCEDGSCRQPPFTSFVPTQFLGGKMSGGTNTGGSGKMRSRQKMSKSRGVGGRGRGLMGALFSSLSADESDGDALDSSSLSDDESSDVTAVASSPVTSSGNKVRLLRMPQIDGDTSDISPSPNGSSNNFENSATADVLVRWKENLYKLSNYASMLCVVDCTVLPIITVLLPLFGIVASPAQAAWLHELGHRVALWFVLPVGGLAATMNYLSLRNPILSSLAALGLSLIYAANGGHHSPLLSRLPHDLAHALHCGTVLHRTVNVVGCSLLLGSNYLSHRLGGCANRDCADERCRR